MFGFIENGWLPIFAFAFHLLQNALLVKVHEENLALLR